MLEHIIHEQIGRWALEGLRDRSLLKSTKRSPFGVAKRRGSKKNVSQTTRTENKSQLSLF